jgi:hypothetical protein
MAVIVFLVIIAVIVVAWALFALMRGSKKVVDEDANLTAGHKFPSETGHAPSLLEDDLSFANRETETSREPAPSATDR